MDQHYQTAPLSCLQSQGSTRSGNNKSEPQQISMASGRIWTLILMMAQTQFLLSLADLTSTYVYSLTSTYVYSLTSTYVYSLTSTYVYSLTSTYVYSLDNSLKGSLPWLQVLHRPASFGRRCPTSTSYIVPWIPVLPALISRSKMTPARVRARVYRVGAYCKGKKIR
jgi:hypothetical protein